MIKRVLFLVIGFGMIAGGVAGIATTIVDRRNEAALDQIERSQEAARLAAAEEERKLDEKRQEVNNLALKVEEEKRMMEEERRLAEQARRAAEAAVQEQKRIARSTLTEAEKTASKDKANKGERKSPTASQKTQKPDRKTVRESRTARSFAAKAPKVSPTDDPLTAISRKAGMEAARFSEPVQYFNRQTGHLILAEPFDFRHDSVRVRIRVWRNDRLVKDKVVSFSAASLGMWGSPRV